MGRREVFLIQKTVRTLKINNERRDNMHSLGKGILVLISIFLLFCLMVFSPARVMAVNAKFDFSKMSDMSDFDPNNPVIPKGDTFKIAVLAPFSGPTTVIGQVYWIAALWAATDYNKRGYND